jgi:NADPH:quinone reductase-like Zn-dependent oxidoreductase
MDAVAYDHYGGPEVLRLVDLPNPKVQADTVLIRVAAAAVNPADCAYRSGAAADSIEAHFPVVPGWDVAGVVEQVGPGATDFAPGDEVLAYVRSDCLSRHGAYATLVAADVRTVARKPAGITWEQAAGLPLAGLTAYQAVVRALRVRDGETMLIHGASGGVGSLAAQIAVARGARVLGSASPRNHAYLASLGAEPVRHGPALAAEVRGLAPGGVDVVLHVAGPQALAATDAVGRSGVRVATVSGDAEHGATQVFARLREEDLAAVVRLAAAGTLAVRIGSVHTYADAPEAHRLVESGDVAGKVVLVPTG